MRYPFSDDEKITMTAMAASVGGGKDKKDAAALAVDRKEVLDAASSFIDGYFKKLISVGIQLLLHDPPTKVGGSTHTQRRGKLFLRFDASTAAADGGPHFLWKDDESSRSSSPFWPALPSGVGGGVTTTPPRSSSPSSPYRSINGEHRINLFDISSIQKPTLLELEKYPFATPGNALFLSVKGGKSDDDVEDKPAVLVLEAMDEIQATRAASGVRGIVAKLARSVIAGDDGWVGRMMMSASSQVADDAAKLTRAMTDATDQLVAMALHTCTYEKKQALSVRQI